MRCPSCERDNLPDSRLCSYCGTALSDDVPQTSSQTQGGSTISASQSVNQGQSEWKAVGMVFAVCAAISLVGWYPLSLPSRGIRALIDMINIAGCADLRPGSVAMYLCSAKIGLMTMAAPILLIVVVFLLRKPLAAWVQRMTPKLPEKTRYLAAPALATVIFTIAWSGAHLRTGTQWGILPQIIFPSVIGFFTYAVAHYGPRLQQPLGGFFDFREKIPNWLRMVIVFAVPMLISIIITAQATVAMGALKEQFVVLVALVNGYLMMTPRSGDIMSRVQQIIPEQEKVT